ncbi:hypothetical protein L2E82_14354 [Cichorium intybus]|uniref:Uncharacterized protein n=1 Tax=Cichorium intybus TaxID=13427 RepID=A0ACB9EZU3_CICIN|nr:hypothetical protein L2E82_14354 [Cichorium intybus]
MVAGMRMGQKEGPLAARMGEEGTEFNRGNHNKALEAAGYIYSNSKAAMKIMLTGGYHALDKRISAYYMGYFCRKFAQSKLA